MIEKKFLKAELKKYSFPRQSPSFDEPSSSSINHVTVYDLNSQNKKIAQQLSLKLDTLSKINTDKRGSPASQLGSLKVLSPRARLLKF